MDIFSYLLGRKSGGGGGSPGGGGGGGGGGGSTEEWIGDGNTHIWISLTEGRTSPMLGVGVNGTVTVDWGDGTEPDVLTGTNVSTIRRTPNHVYTKAGDYVITLSGSGSIKILGNQTYPTYLLSATDSNSKYYGNHAYANAIKKIELGDNVVGIGSYALMNCSGLSKILISGSVTNLDSGAISYCNLLRDVVFLGTPTTISGNMFEYCYSLPKAVFPKGATTIPSCMFRRCDSLTDIVVPDGITTIRSSAFYNCKSVVNVLIPASVTSFENSAFADCYSVVCYDFSHHTTVPALSGTNAFAGSSPDCIFNIPASLYDEWIAATNWSALAETYTFVGV